MTHNILHLYKVCPRQSYRFELDNVGIQFLETLASSMKTGPLWSEQHFMDLPSAEGSHCST